MLCRPEGPRSAKIALVGEAPGEEEERTGRPFVGASGQELNRMLTAAGINRDDCWVTNVFLERPPHNDLERWMAGKKEIQAPLVFPAFARGKYLKPEYAHHVLRLRTELLELRPNVIVALGGTALWALAGTSAIGTYRGTIVPTPYGKLLPTFHPASVLRAWNNRVVSIVDLAKAKRHSSSPDYSRPKRNILIRPTLAEVSSFFKDFLWRASLISIDVETAKKQITSMSFAPSKETSIAIPLVASTASGGSYYSRSDELAIWREVRGILNSPIPKLFQNGSYDIQYFLAAGCTVRGPFEDTLIQQHARYPELPKGLDFLASIHCDEVAWKKMRNTETTKRDE